MTKSYFKKVNGVVLVFSLQNRQSFKNIEKWMRLLQNEVEESMPKVLIGSKFDLCEQRTISAMEARLLAEKYNMDYVQVSAKLGYNIEKPFELLTQNIVSQESEEDEEVVARRGVTRLSSWKSHVNSCQC